MKSYLWFFWGIDLIALKYVSFLLFTHDAGDSHVSSAPFWEMVDQEKYVSLNLSLISVVSLKSVTIQEVYAVTNQDAVKVGCELLTNLNPKHVY